MKNTIFVISLITILFTGCGDVMSRFDNVNFEIDEKATGHDYAIFSVTPSDNTHRYYHAVFTGNPSDEEIFSISIEAAKQDSEATGLSFGEYMDTKTMPGKRDITLTELRPDTEYVLGLFCVEDRKMVSKVTRYHFSTEEDDDL